MTTKERWDVLTEVIDALSNHMSERHQIRAARKGSPLPVQTVQFQRGEQQGLNAAVRLVARLRDGSPTRSEV